jgi:hypothetical protein
MAVIIRQANSLISTKRCPPQRPSTVFGVLVLAGAGFVELVSLGWCCPPASASNSALRQRIWFMNGPA